MSGLPVVAIFRLIDQLRAESDLYHKRESLLIGSLLAGNRGATLLGKRVEFELHWPDGLPWGMTQEQLRSFGAEMFIEAGGDPFAVQPLGGDGEEHDHSAEHGAQQRTNPSGQGEQGMRQS